MPLLPSGGGAHGRGYSAPLIVFLCALSFMAGCFLRDLPGLPGPSDSPPLQPDTQVPKTSLRRSALELQHQAQVRVSPHASSTSESARAPAARSFEEAVEASGMLGDRPPVQTGDSGLGSYVVQPMQVLSWYPRTVLFPKFIDAERAKHIRELAAKRLAPSGLALKKGDTIESQKNVRTSQGTFLSRGDDPDGVLAWVEDKLSQLTGIPTGHGEAFNCLRYESSQHYAAHYDTFNAESYGPQASQRMATALIYLSDVEEGGATVLPLEGRSGLDRLQNIDYSSCDMGLKVQPRLGDALLFWSLHPNGTFDRHALHGGCPVVSGTKWVLTKWLRDKMTFGPAP